MKTILHKTVGTHVLSVEELYSILADVEAFFKGAVAHGVSRSIKFSQIFCVGFIVFLYMSTGCVSTFRT